MPNEERNDTGGEDIQARIIFHLEKDEDDFPPNEWETLWASKVGEDLFAIDNIPFYVREISCGDVVKVNRLGGDLYFEEIAKRSRNSVLRVIVYDEANVGQLRSDLLGMNCESEQSHIPNLIALEVPGDVVLDEVLEFLDKGEIDQLWEYETASLRQ